VVISRERSSCLGHKAEWFETSRAIVVVLEEESVDVEFVEESLGDEVVTTFGGPVGLEVTPTRVGGDGHAFGRPAIAALICLM